MPMDRSNNDWDIALDAARTRDPRDYQFGLFLSWDDPFEDKGEFLWFKSPTLAGHFLRDSAGIVCGVEPHSDEERTYRVDLAPALEVLQSGGLTLDFRALFNEIFSGWLRIGWCGTFADLRKGKGGLVAERVVREFLASRKMTGSTIPDASAEQFVEWLAEWYG